MANYKSTYTGAQIDEAITKVENGDLPIASATSLGGVKIGDGISVTEDGTISASGGSGGTKLYKHYMMNFTETYMTSLIIISTKNTSYNDILSIIQDSNIISSYVKYSYGTQSITSTCTLIKNTTLNALNIGVITMSGGAVTMNNITTPMIFNDMVTEL